MSDDKQRSDCGCWTDAAGYWQLSEACRLTELQTWSDMMDRYRGRSIMDWKSNLVATTPHERAVRYFRQELGKK